VKTKRLLRVSSDGRDGVACRETSGRRVDRTPSFSCPAPPSGSPADTLWRHPPAACAAAPALGQARAGYDTRPSGV